jgi:hypothetical protein
MSGQSLRAEFVLPAAMPAKLLDIVNRCSHCWILDPFNERFNVPLGALFPPRVPIFITIAGGAFPGRNF